jgi:hypothetical protein
MEINVSGQDVSRITFDYALTIETSGGIELRFESRFRLVDRDGVEEVEGEPESLDVTGGAIVKLLHKPIDELTVDGSGVLTVSFTTGRRLVCDPDERFEAWTLVTSTGERIVCMPGGGVAHWPGTVP